MLELEQFVDQKKKFGQARRSGVLIHFLEAVLKNKAILLIIGFTVISYHGILLLGLCMDDYSALYLRESQSWISLAREPGNNRFPLFALVILPVLLQSPSWLAHLVIIIVHAASAILLFYLLLSFDLGEITSTIAALLFLLWPAHAEALFWIVASTVVFGACCVLAGALLLTRKRLILGIGLIFLGMTFSEGILLPALFLQLVVLLRGRYTIVQAISLCLCSIALYGLFQAGRHMISVSEQLAQYPIGFESAWINVRDLVLMSLGVASSHDVVWLWVYGVNPIDVGLLLPAPFLLLAVMAILVTWQVFQSLDYGPMLRYNLRTVLKITAVALVGYGSALLIFAIVSGNLMQTRYTYTSVIYLAVLLALPLGWLFASRRQMFKQIAWICTVAVLSWSMYRTWSNIWENWYPATQLSSRLIADIKTAYAETQVPDIFVVNPPQAVGNAYSLSRRWAFTAVGRLYVGSKVEVWTEDTGILLTNNKLPPGSRFSERPCVFLGWRDGQHIVEAEALSDDQSLLLDCRTGLVRAAAPNTQRLLVFHFLKRTSQENLKDVLGTSP